MVFKGGSWYQNEQYLIEKHTFATEIEYMGLLPQRSLISKSDN